MILHLVDDEKVINRTIDFFERALPGRNIFLCFCKKDSNGQFFPKHVNRDKIIFFDEDRDSVPNCIENVDQVIVHALYFNKISFINNYIPSTTDVCWFVWGADLYSQILFPMGYPLYPLGNSHITTKEWIACKIKRIIGYKSRQSRFLIDFIRRRITSVGCCDGDYYLLQRYLKLGDIKRVLFYYYPIEDVLGSLYGKSIYPDANLIMCGNSAAEANNHEYIINCLKRFDLSDYKVVMPLSYCGSDDYKNRIISIGAAAFGSNFKPITEFLPLDIYNNLFLKVKTCIYASWRQMAVGNIIVALYLGSKVFLSKHNPWLSDAKNMGLTVFTLENAKKDIWLQTLSSEEKDSNRQIIENLFSSERLLILIKEHFGQGCC